MSSSLTLASTEITAFHYVGGVLALWAVVVAALGIMRHDFPGKGPGQTIVMAISGLLVAGAVGTAVVTAEDGPKGGGLQAGMLNKVGPEGTEEPEEGGAVAPGTGPEQGQEPGGNAQPAPRGGTITKLLISAVPNGQLAFDKDQLEAPAGRVRITMNNPSDVPHNVAIEGADGVDEVGKVVEKGGASEIEADVKAGTYTYYCSVPGHRPAGMEGVLTVK